MRRIVVLCLLLLCACVSERSIAECGRLLGKTEAPHDEPNHASRYSGPFVAFDAPYNAVWSRPRAPLAAFEEGDGGREIGFGPPVYWEFCGAGRLWHVLVRPPVAADALAESLGDHWTMEMNGMTVLRTEQDKDGWTFMYHVIAPEHLVLIRIPRYLSFSHPDDMVQGIVETMEFRD